MSTITYFHWWGFSINEGGKPCLHCSWHYGFFLHAYCSLFEIVLCLGKACGRRITFTFFPKEIR